MAVEIEGVGQEVLQAIGAVGVAIVAAVWLLLRPKPTPRILASEAARIAAARASQQQHSGASATAGGSSGEGVGAGAGAGAGVGADTADTTTQNVRHRGDRGGSSTSQGTSNATPESAAQPPPAAPTSQSCPICLESPPSCMVQTSCGHLFCTDCVLYYWDATFRPSALVCPCCRGKVTLLLRRFGEQEAGAVAAASRIDDYNLLFSNSLRSWWRYAQDAPVLIRRALADVMAGRILVFSALGLKLIGVMVLFVLYLLSPLDIVPEAAFGIAGYIDDLAIALFVLAYCATIYRAFIIANAQQHAQQAAAGAAAAT